MAHEEFAKWLKKRVEQEGGVRRAAAKSGVAHVTILRAMEGGSISLKTLEGISRWTGLDLVSVLRLYGAELSGEERQVSDTLARLLDQYPQLESTLAVSLENLDEDDLVEIVKFIEFRAAMHSDESHQ